MKKKKLMALFLCLSMALSTALTGCGGSDSNQNTGSQTGKRRATQEARQTQAIRQTRPKTPAAPFTQGFIPANLLR